MQRYSTVPYLYIVSVNINKGNNLFPVFQAPTVDKNAEVQVRKKRQSAVGSEEKGHHHHHATGELAAQHSHGETKSEDHHDHDHSGVETHSLIGITLVAGFILMLIVDQISQRHTNTNSFSEAVTVAQQSSSIDFKYFSHSF